MTGSMDSKRKVNGGAGGAAEDLDDRVAKRRRVPSVSHPRCFCEPRLRCRVDVGCAFERWSVAMRLQCDGRMSRDFLAFAPLRQTLQSNFTANNLLTSNKEIDLTKGETVETTEEYGLAFLDQIRTTKDKRYVHLLDNTCCDTPLSPRNPQRRACALGPIDPAIAIQITKQSGGLKSCTVARTLTMADIRI